MNRRYIDFVPANNSTANTKAPVKTTVRKTTVVRTIEEDPIDFLDESIDALIEVPVEAPVRTQRKSPAKLVRSAKSVKSARPVKPNPQPRSAMVTRTRATKPAPAVRRAPTVSTSVAPTINASTPATKKMPASSGLALGVVEDLNSHFVNTNVPKRPLSEKPARPVQPVRRSAQPARRPAQSARRSTQPSVTDLKAKKVKAGLSTKSVATSVKKPVSKPTPKTGLSKEASTYKAPKPTFINQNKVVKRPLSGGNVYHKQPPKATKEEPKGPVTIIAKPEKEKHIGIIVTIIITIILGAAAGTVAFLLLPK